MKTTRYFDEQVIRKRSYLIPAWLAAAIERPVRRDVQPDGRIRQWTRVTDNDGRTRYLRVVTLEDGLTIHNAFFDRDFREDAP